MKTTVLAIGLLLTLATPVLATPSSGCVGCHTDEAMLKSLFTPPTLGPSEGEG